MLFYGFWTAIFNLYHVNVNKHNAYVSDFRRNPCCNGQLCTNWSYLKNNKWCNTLISMSQIFHHESTLTDIIYISFQKRYPLYKQVIQHFRYFVVKHIFSSFIIFVHEPTCVEIFWLWKNEKLYRKCLSCLNFQVEIQFYTKRFLINDVNCFYMVKQFKCMVSMITLK